MRCNNAKKFIGEALTVMILTTCSIPVSAQELNTEIASAGAAVELQNYIENAGSEEDLAKYLPAPEQTQQSVETTEKKEESKESKIFSDIAIARVSGEGDYVNVRKKPSVKSKRLGKIYNNCGARIIETTKNGWYKIVSGNCSGYIKAEYFVTGQKAASNALDNGYVFANIKENGIHVRESYTTESAVVTNVYKNENYVIKKFSDDGKWVKVKIGDGVSGWVSADYAKVSVDMETAITNAEERAKIKAQKERERKESVKHSWQHRNRKLSSRSMIHSSLMRKNKMSRLQITAVPIQAAAIHITVSRKKIHRHQTLHLTETVPVQALQKWWHMQNSF